MQVYKPFRLRGPLDGASNAPAFPPSATLFLSFSLSLPVTFPATRPFRAIYQPRPARSLNSLHRCSFAISTSFLRIAIAPGKHDKAYATLSGTGAYLRALFFQATQAFSQESTRTTPTSREKNKSSVAIRYPCSPLCVSASLRHCALIGLPRPFVSRQLDSISTGSSRRKRFGRCSHGSASPSVSSILMSGGRVIPAVCSTYLMARGNRAFTSESVSRVISASELPTGVNLKFDARRQRVHFRLPRCGTTSFATFFGRGSGLPWHLPSRCLANAAALRGVSIDR